jgi:hypothetical protein
VAASEHVQGEIRRRVAAPAYGLVQRHAWVMVTDERGHGTVQPSFRLAAIRFDRGVVASDRRQEFARDILVVEKLDSGPAEHPQFRQNPSVRQAMNRFGAPCGGSTSPRDEHDARRDPGGFERSCDLERNDRAETVTEQRDRTVRLRQHGRKCRRGKFTHAV